MVRSEPFGAVSNGLEQLSPGLNCSKLLPGVSARDMGHGGAGATPDEAVDWATERARWTFGRHTATKVLGRGRWSRHASPRALICTVCTLVKGAGKLALDFANSTNAWRLTI